MRAASGTNLLVLRRLPKRLLLVVAVLFLLIAYLVYSARTPKPMLQPTTVISRNIASYGWAQIAITNPTRNWILIDSRTLGTQSISFGEDLVLWSIPNTQLLDFSELKIQYVKEQTDSLREFLHFTGISLKRSSVFGNDWNPVPVQLDQSLNSSTNGGWPFLCSNSALYRD